MATRGEQTSVVIVGAGVACAGRLGDRGVHVTLVDRHNDNQFQPLLYQLATAQVGTANVARPRRGHDRTSSTRPGPTPTPSRFMRWRTPSGCARVSSRSSRMPTAIGR